MWGNDRPPNRAKSGAPRCFKYDFLRIWHKIMLWQGASSHIGSKFNSPIERPDNFLRKLAFAWSVRAIWFKIALWHGMSSHLDSMAGSLAACTNIFQRNSVCVSSIVTISLKITLWHGTSSYLASKASSEVELPDIFLRHVALALEGRHIVIQNRSPTRSVLIFSFESFQIELLVG